jgi:hypothetical protein
MEYYQNKIDEQIAFNQGKNIFGNSANKPLRFSKGTTKAFSDMGRLSAKKETDLIDYTIDKTIEEFCRVNQYYSFNSQSKNDLRKIYIDLFSRIKTNNYSTNAISNYHFESLKQWIQKTNPFAEKLYGATVLEINPAPCSEYNPDLQISILEIDYPRLLEPVLDIGCGKKGNFVKHLNSNGIAAYGIDRFAINQNNLINSDWLAYDYGIEKWGTIVSHLGFTNHFKHHHLREDGNYLEYAMKYMEVLKSLKPGGHFHYAPDLPFIELYLDTKQFKIEKYEIGKLDIKTTVITRLNG